MQPPMISLQDQTGWISLHNSDSKEAKQNRSTANDHHSRKGELEGAQRLLGKVNDHGKYSKGCRVDSPVVAHSRMHVLACMPLCTLMPV